MTKVNSREKMFDESRNMFEKFKKFLLSKFRTNNSIFSSIGTVIQIYFNNIIHNIDVDLLN